MTLFYWLRLSINGPSTASNSIRTCPLITDTQINTLGQMVQPWECKQTDTLMDTGTHRHYQMHYLPALQSITIVTAFLLKHVPGKSLALSWFLLKSSQYILKHDKNTPLFTIILTSNQSHIKTLVTHILDLGSQMLPGDSVQNTHYYPVINTT